MIRSESAEAQMIYGLLLLYVRNDPTGAQSFLDEAHILSTLEIDQIKFRIDQDEKKEAMERKLQQEKRRRRTIKKETRWSIAANTKNRRRKTARRRNTKAKVISKESRKRRTKVLEQVLRVVEVANSRAQEFNNYAVPFQALWRGHVARCKHGPGT